MDFKILQHDQEWGPYPFEDLRQTIFDTIVADNDLVVFDGSDKRFRVSAVRSAVGRSGDGDLFAALEEEHERCEQREEDKLRSLSQSIPADANIFLRDAEDNKVGPYRPLQIRRMFEEGRIYANAEFYWQTLGAWWPVADSSLVNDENRLCWEYFAITLKISGASMGLLSAMSAKDVKHDSLIQLANLGEEGWELVTMAPVIHGAIGAVSTDAAVAILKRKIKNSWGA